jgi:hypothetical protein
MHGYESRYERVEATADDWQFLLQEKGYIYSQKHEGWYSVTDEAFYPQSAVQPYLDPSTGRKMIVRKATASVPLFLDLTVDRLQSKPEAKWNGRRKKTTTFAFLHSATSSSSSTSINLSGLHPHPA